MYLFFVLKYLFWFQAKAAIHAVQTAGEASKNLAQSAGEAFANATKGTPIN